MSSNEKYMVTFEKKDIKNIKSYTLKDYKAFCDEALQAPPIEEFEKGTIDEAQWDEEHKVNISVGGYNIELDYTADVVNEIEWALREMYEEEYGSGEPTTGNTKGSSYRAATIVDFMEVYIDKLIAEGSTYKNALQLTRTSFTLETIEEIRRYATDPLVINIWKCNFAKMDMTVPIPINGRERTELLRKTLCSNYEVSYDPQADRSYIVDFSLRDCGELVGFTWGCEEAYIQDVIERYKEDMLEAD